MSQSDTDEDKLICLYGVSAGYEDRVVLDGISMVIGKHTQLIVEGPNGSGKTTFVKLLLGVIEPLSGTMVKKVGLRIGYLPQVNDYDVEFPISAREVILSGATRVGFRHTKEQIAKANELMEFAGVGKYADQHFGTLSGGQRQRCYLCRALMNDPELLILDEPTTFMDREATKSLAELLESLKGKMATVVITHADLRPSTTRIWR